jgi:hypothetical protein
MSQHEDTRRPDSGETDPQDGQVSELHDVSDVAEGGADSTDKSTGTAPDEATEPPA